MSKIDYEVNFNIDGEPSSSGHDGSKKPEANRRPLYDEEQTNLQIVEITDDNPLSGANIRKRKQSRIPPCVYIPPVPTLNEDVGKGGGYEIIDGVRRWIPNTINNA